jgi:acyl-CoA thioesterase 11
MKRNKIYEWGDYYIDRADLWPTVQWLLYYILQLTSPTLNFFLFWLIPPPPVRAEAKNPYKTTMTHLVRQVHADSRGIVFGGQILCWMDLCAGIAANRHAGVKCVSILVDAVHFLSRVEIGHICIVKATVNRSWGTSMEIGVSVESEDMKTGIVLVCCHGCIIVD